MAEGSRRIFVEIVVDDANARARLLGVDQAIDRAGKTAAQATAQLNALSGATERASVAAGTATGTTTAHTGATTASTAAVVKHAEGQRRATEMYAESDRGLVKLTNTIRTVGRDFEQAGAALTMFVTLPIVGATTAGLKFAMDFEANMVKVVTLSGVTETEMQKMRQAILDMAPAVGIGPGALSAALMKVTSIGIREAAPAMDLLRVAAKGSAIGLGEVSVVADALTSVLVAYKNTNMDAAKAGDILYGTVLEGKGELTEFAGSMSRVVGIAATLGISLADVGTYLAGYTRMGASAHEASTALRRTMTALSAQELPQAAKALDSVNWSFDRIRDTIKEKGLIRTILELTKTFDGNWTALSELFGNIRAFTGVLAISGNQAKDVEAILANLEKRVWSMDPAFARTADTMAFRWNQVKAQFEEVAIALGETLFPKVRELIPMFQKFAESLIAVIGWFSKLSPGVQDAMLKFVALGIAIGPAMYAMGGFLRVGGAVVDLLIVAGRIGLVGLLTQAVMGVQAFGMALVGGGGLVAAVTTTIPVLGQIVIAIAAVSAALYAGSIAWDLWKQRQAAAQDAQAQLAQDQRAMADATRITGRTVTDAATAYQILDMHAETLRQRFLAGASAAKAAADETTAAGAAASGTKNGWADLSKAMAGYRAELAQLTGPQRDLLTRALKDGVLSMKELAEMTKVSENALQLFAKQMREGGTAAKSNAAELKRVTEEMQKVERGIPGVVPQLNEMVVRFMALEAAAGAASVESAAFYKVILDLQQIETPTLKGLWTVLDQIFKSTRVAPELLERTRTWRDQLHSIAGMLSEVFQGINSNIGQSIQIITRGLDVLVDKVDASGKKIAATVSEKWVAGLAMAAGLASQFMDMSTKVGAATVGMLSGAAAGAGIGTLIAPGIGTAIGAAAGALVGLFAGLAGHAKQLREANAQATAEIAKMQAALLQQYGTLEKVAAIGRVVGVDLAAAWGDKSLAGLQHFTGLTKEFEAVLGRIRAAADSATRGIVMLSAEQVAMIQALQATGGVNFDAFFAAQYANVVTGAVGLVDAFYKTFGEEFATQGGENVVTQVGDMITIALPEATAAGAEAFARYSRIIETAFATSLLSGRGFLASINEIGSALDQLAGLAEKYGLKAGATLEILLGWRQFAKENPETVAALDALNQMMSGLHNSGMLNEQMFRDLGATAYDIFHKMELKGKGGEQGLRAMQPTLQGLWQIWKDTGWVVDDNTLKLLKYAEHSGVVGDQFKTDGRKQVDALELIKGILGDLTKFFREDFVNAIRDAFAATQREATDTGGVIDRELGRERVIRGRWEIPEPPPDPGAPMHYGGLVMHQGGYVERPSGGLLAGIDWTRTARAHAGLGPDEVPIIAQRGERILSRTDTSAFDALGGLVALKSSSGRGPGSRRDAQIPAPISTKAIERKLDKLSDDLLTVLPDITARIARDAVLLRP